MFGSQWVIHAFLGKQRPGRPHTTFKCPTPAHLFLGVPPWFLCLFVYCSSFHFSCPLLARLFRAIWQLGFYEIPISMLPGLTVAPPRACKPWGAKWFWIRWVSSTTLCHSLTWASKQPCFLSVSQSLPQASPETLGSHLLKHWSERSRKGTHAILSP